MLPLCQEDTGNKEYFQIDPNLCVRHLSDSLNFAPFGENSSITIQSGKKRQIRGHDVVLQKVGLKTLIYYFPLNLQNQMLKETASTQKTPLVTQLLLQEVNRLLQHLSTFNSICHPVEEVKAAKHPVTLLQFKSSFGAEVYSHKSISIQFHVRGRQKKSTSKASTI